MSYEDNRGGYGKGQEERRGGSQQQGRHHQQQEGGQYGSESHRKDNDFQSSGYVTADKLSIGDTDDNPTNLKRYRRDEFDSYPPSRDEGNVNRGGYGKDAEGDSYGHRGHQQNLDDPESTGYDQPARNYSQRRNEDGRGRNDDYGSGRQGSGTGARTEYSPQSGRQAVGSGESYVGLGNRGGDDYRATSDAYGGEGLTSGQGYQPSNTQHTKPYASSGNRNDNDNDLNNNRKNEYGSSNQAYGSMDSSSHTGGSATGSNLANWKPGQEMQFAAAERETEANPYAGDAQGLAGETHNFMKQGIKDLEKSVGVSLTFTHHTRSLTRG